jgi:antagonist of KipI
MSFKVIKPGMLSTFQDGGRWGYQSLGVSVCGAMDLVSHHLANLIVGNSTDVATLEVTLMGPTLVFNQACCVCLTGADMQAKLNNKPVARFRPIVIKAGETLTMPLAKEGTRAYIAVHGGFALPLVMGSQSTYLRSGFGGWNGRALLAGDEVRFNRTLDDAPEKLNKLSNTLWDTRIYLPSSLGAWSLRKSTVRWVKSTTWPEFTRESQQAVLQTTWRVANDADRMGFRLDGPKLALSVARERLSEPTTFGTIQVPAAGQPIVLMADRQTSGGYAKLGCVASVDLPILAQKKPGDEIRFLPIDVEQAQALDTVRQNAFEELAVQLASMHQHIRDTASSINRTGDTIP